MTDLPSPNDGTRPSKLALDALLTGERHPADSPEAAAWLAGEGAAHRAATEAAGAALPPFDASAIRHRATSAVSEPVAHTPVTQTWVQWAGLFGVAAALFLTALPSTDVGQPLAPPTTLTAKGSALTLWTLDGATLVPHDGSALPAGAIVGLRAHPGTHRSAVVLELDGQGALTVLHPQRGSDPVPVQAGAGEVGFPGTLILDDAAGPELFVVVWDQSLPEARAALTAAHAAGGVEGVRRWALASSNVDLAVAEKR